MPTLAVPDNAKTAVTRACRYDPDLNPTYQEFAVHYGMGVVPARPYKPRDKAKVESGVQVVERWIVAALRHRKFFSLDELNRAIRELLALASLFASATDHGPVCFTRWKNPLWRPRPPSDSI